MALPLLYPVLALGAAVAGYFRYEQVKVDDLVQYKDPITGVLATMKVTRVDKDSLTGNPVNPVDNTALPVAISVKRGNVTKNLTPRFALLTSEKW